MNINKSVFEEQELKEKINKENKTKEDYIEPFEIKNKNYKGIEERENLKETFERVFGDLTDKEKERLAETIKELAQPKTGIDFGTEFTNEQYTTIALDGITVGKANIESEDLINTPNHYHKGGMDIYEIMQAKLSPEEYKGFCKGNVLKYLLRADLKGSPVPDLKKLRFNTDRAIEAYEGIKYIPEHKRGENK